MLTFNRSAVFIDQNNMPSMGNIDYKKLHNYITSRPENQRVMSFNLFCVTPPRDEEHQIFKVLDWLTFNGYRVKTCERWTVQQTDRNTGEERTIDRGSILIDFSLAAVEMLDTIDHYIIIAANGVYATLMDYLLSKGKQVTLISTFEAKTLRRCCSNFIDVKSPEVAQEICYENRPTENNGTA